MLYILISLFSCICASIFCCAMDLSRPEQKKFWVYVCASAIPFVAEYDYTEVEGFVGGFCALLSHFKFYYLALPFMIYLTAVKVRQILIDNPLPCHRFFVAAPAAFFSLVLLFGYSYERHGTWELVFNVPSGQLVKSAIMFAGLFSVLSFGVALCYVALEYIQRHRFLSGISKTHKCGRLLRAYLAALQLHPFRTSFLTLLLCYGPLLILSYPGSLVWDNHVQIVQGFRDVASYIPAGVDYVPRWVNLTDHHPLIHTMLLHSCIMTGLTLFSSATAGIFLFAVFQFLFLLLVLAFSITLLVRSVRVGSLVPAVVLLFFCIHPGIGAQLFSLTKDTLYAASFLGFFVALALRYISMLSGRHSFLPTLLFLFFCASCVVFRNEGKYVVLMVCLAEFAFVKESRARLLLCILPLLLAFICLYSLAVPRVLHAAQSSKLDTFCIPIQQIGRCVSLGYVPSGAEDRALLKTLFDEEKLASYNPSLADSAKSAARFTVTREVMAPFSRLWWSFIREYPGTCIQATLHHHYQTFYPKTGYSCFPPSQGTNEYIRLVNEKTQYIGVTFEEVPWIHKVFICYEVARDKMASLTPLGTLMVNAATYTWCVILLTFYAAYHRNRKAISLLSPFYVVMLMLILGPCAGDYQRYLSPFYFAFPILLPCLLKLIRIRSRV